ncbi:MAG: hypothetical protein ACLS61_10405 [Ruminococcus sp.]
MQWYICWRNLTTAINVKTGNGGAVIYGGVRDIEQMKKIDTQVFYRGIDPTPIRECVLTDSDGPCRIGGAVCLPGDSCHGDREWSVVCSQAIWLRK